VVDSSSYRDHAAAKSWHCRGVNVSFPNCFQNLTNPLLVHMTYLGTRVLEIVLIADDNHFHVSLEELSRDKPFSVQQPISLIKLLTTFITSLEIYIMFIGYHVSVALSNSSMQYSMPFYFKQQIHRLQPQCNDIFQLLFLLIP
jgi:hypothetical protein